MTLGFAPNDHFQFQSLSLFTSCVASLPFSLAEGKPEPKLCTVEEAGTSSRWFQGPKEGPSSSQLLLET
jgi:hypothetical protein